MTERTAGAGQRRDANDDTQWQALFPEADGRVIDGKSRPERQHEDAGNREAAERDEPSSSSEVPSEPPGFV
jgi:hypothetical protein